MQANQLEPSIKSVRNAKRGKEQRLPGLLDDAAIGDFRRVANRFAPGEGNQHGARAADAGNVDNRRVSAEAAGLNWARSRPISTAAGPRNSSSRCRAMPALRISSLLVAIAAGATLSACSTTIEQRGNLPPPEEITQIHPGKTTKDQVVKILGTPSSVSIFSDKDWYYISSRTKQFSFFDPKVLDQQVFIVNFNNDGIVRAVDHKTLEDGHDVVPIARAT